MCSVNFRCVSNVTPRFLTALVAWIWAPLKTNVKWSISDRMPASIAIICVYVSLSFVLWIDRTTGKVFAEILLCGCSICATFCFLQLVINLDIVGMLYCSDTLWRVQAQIVWEKRVDQSMKWTGSVRRIENLIQSKWIWAGLDYKITCLTDSGLDWIGNLPFPYFILQDKLLLSWNI